MRGVVLPDLLAVSSGEDHCGVDTKLIGPALFAGVMAGFMHYPGGSACCARILHDAGAPYGLHAGGRWSSLRR